MTAYTLRNAAICATYADGASLRECGEQFGITRSRAWQILRKLGVQRRKQGRPFDLDAFVRRASDTIDIQDPSAPTIIQRALQLARAG